MGWQSLINPISSLLDKIVPDADERSRLAHEIATMSERHLHEINLAQIGVNKEEAKSDSLFTSGWRPAAGWICVIALGFNSLFIPFIDNVYISWGRELNFQPLDMEYLFPLLMGMLGLSWNRTTEKLQGKERKTWNWKK